jgi:hypothetical protein
VIAVVTSSFLGTRRTRTYHSSPKRERGNADTSLAHQAIVVCFQSPLALVDEPAFESFRSVEIKHGFDHLVDVALHDLVQFMN